MFEWSLEIPNGFAKSKSWNLVWKIVRKIEKLCLDSIGLYLKKFKSSNLMKIWIWFEKIQKLEFDENSNLIWKNSKTRFWFENFKSSNMILKIVAFDFESGLKMMKPWIWFENVKSSNQVCKWKKLIWFENFKSLNVNWKNSKARIWFENDKKI